MNEKTTWRTLELRGALLGPFVVQVLFMALSALILDGGFCASIVMAAIVGHWLMILWIALRRRNALTKLDTILIRVGFFVWLLIATLITIVLQAIA